MSQSEYLVQHVSVMVCEILVDNNNDCACDVELSMKINMYFVGARLVWYRVVSNVCVHAYQLFSTPHTWVIRWGEAFNSLDS